MCEGSFLPSSFGPHQKHTEFESSLRSYPISSNVLCKLSKLHGTAEAMCNENRGFLTASLEMDKRRRPARSGLLQNGSQGRDRWGWRRVALGSGRPYTCPISEHSRSANASVPPISKKLSSGLIGDRCSTRRQISVRVSTVVGMS